MSAPTGQTLALQGPRCVAKAGGDVNASACAAAAELVAVSIGVVEVSCSRDRIREVRTGRRRPLLFQARAPAALRLAPSTRPGKAAIEFASRDVDRRCRVSCFRQAVIVLDRESAFTHRKAGQRSGATHVVVRRSWKDSGAYIELFTPAPTGAHPLCRSTRSCCCEQPRSNGRPRRSGGADRARADCAASMPSSRYRAYRRGGPCPKKRE
jgi:hypothetical protein